MTQPDVTPFLTNDGVAEPLQHPNQAVSGNIPGRLHAAST